MLFYAQPLTAKKFTWKLAFSPTKTFIIVRIQRSCMKVALCSNEKWPNSKSIEVADFYCGKFC